MYLDNVGDVGVQEANTINHGCDGPAKHSIRRIDGTIRLDNDAGGQVQAARMVGWARHHKLIPAAVQKLRALK